MLLGLNFIQIRSLQGAAFLNIYNDGTVLLSHGGVECGQGLHTKMIQVVILRIMHAKTAMFGQTLRQSFLKDISTP